MVQREISISQIPETNIFIDTSFLRFHKLKLTISKENLPFIQNLAEIVSELPQYAKIDRICTSEAWGWVADQIDLSDMTRDDVDCLNKYLRILKPQSSRDNVSNLDLLPDLANFEEVEWMPILDSLDATINRVKHCDTVVSGEEGRHIQDFVENSTTSVKVFICNVDIG